VVQGGVVLPQQLRVPAQAGQVVTALRTAVVLALLMALVTALSAWAGPPAGSPWYCWEDADGPHCSTRVPFWIYEGDV
jgi:hypothetical protein